MRELTILYDADCDLCCRLRLWLEKEPAFLPLRFAPLQSTHLPTRYPGITELHPEREIVVIADDGRYWQGGDAWIVCLWALRDWRDMSVRLAGPLLRPLAKKAALFVAERRRAISRWVPFWKKETFVADLEKFEPRGCLDGRCAR